MCNDNQDHCFLLVCQSYGKQYSTQCRPHSTTDSSVSLSDQVTHKQADAGGEIISAWLFVQQGSPQTLLIVSSLRAGDVVCTAAQQWPVQKRAPPARWAAHSNKSRESDRSAHEQSSCSYCMLVLWLRSFFPPQAGVPTITGTAILVITLIMYSTGIEQTSAHNVHFEPVPRLWPPQHSVLIMYTRSLHTTPASIRPVAISKFKNLNRGGNTGRVQHQNTARSL